MGLAYCACGCPSTPRTNNKKCNFEEPTNFIILLVDVLCCVCMLCLLFLVGVDGWVVSGGCFRYGICHESPVDEPTDFLMYEMSYYLFRVYLLRSVSQRWQAECVGSSFTFQRAIGLWALPVALVVARLPRVFLKLYGLFQNCEPLLIMFGCFWLSLVSLSDSPRNFQRGTSFVSESRPQKCRFFRLVRFPNNP